MVSIDQIKVGIAKYLEDSIIPMFTGWKALVAATVASLALDKAEGLIKKLKDNPMVTALGIIDDSGMVDVDVLYKHLKTNIRSLPATFEIPGAGIIALNEADLDKLYHYIKG